MYSYSTIFLDTLIWVHIIFAVIFIAFIVIGTREEEKESKKFKYKVTVIKGNMITPYYTNEYKIKDNVIYFNNMCANSFVVKEIKKEA